MHHMAATHVVPEQNVSAERGVLALHVEDGLNELPELIRTYLDRQEMDRVCSVQCWRQDLYLGQGHSCPVIFVGLEVIGKRPVHADLIREQEQVRG
jgi:hypothetical protein